MGEGLRPPSRSARDGASMASPMVGRSSSSARSRVRGLIPGRVEAALDELLGEVAAWTDGILNTKPRPRRGVAHREEWRRSQRFAAHAQERRDLAAAAKVAVLDDRLRPPDREKKSMTRGDELLMRS